MTNQKSLIEACKNDAAVEMIRSLIDNGADVMARDYNGRTPLLWACEYSTDIKVLELLIARGANVNDIYWPSPSQRNDHSALSIVCREDKPSEFVELLLSKGADPNYQVYDTPLAYCFGYADYSMDYEVKTKFKNTLKTAELLLMAGAKTDTITLDIPLSAHAPEEVILFLFTQCGKQATAEDFYRFCTYAVPSENLINWFMAQGAAHADLRRIIGLLCYQENSYSSIQYILGLVQNHSYWNTIVSLDADNPYKGTILHYACHNNRQDLVTLFLELGVDPEILDSGCQYVFQLSLPSSVTLSLLKAGKLVVICNDWSKPRSSSNTPYTIIARDKTGNIREQEWNYTDKMGPEIEAHLLAVAKNFAFQCNGNQCIGPAGAPIKEKH